MNASENNEAEKNQMATVQPYHHAESDISTTFSNSNRPALQNSLEQNETALVTTTSNSESTDQRSQEIDLNISNASDLNSAVLQSASDSRKCSTIALIPMVGSSYQPFSDIPSVPSTFLDSNRSILPSSETAVAATATIDESTNEARDMTSQQIDSNILSVSPASNQSVFNSSSDQNESIVQSEVQDENNDDDGNDNGEIIEVEKILDKRLFRRKVSYRLFVVNTSFSHKNRR